MANEQNLITMADRPKEEVRELARKAGRASAAAKKKRKAMRQQMELLLSLPLKDKEIKEKIKSLGIDDDNMDNQMGLIVSTYTKAMLGDMNAMNIIRELVGEKVIEVKVDAAIDSNVKELQSILDEL